MHIHILGIAGTFMGSLAILAKQQGFKVTGSDVNIYPPMSDQLEQQGIDFTAGYEASQLDINPDLVVVGNALSRGNPVIEATLNLGLAYTSGPEFLARYLLPGKWVLAVAGTHGKTTTSSMLSWILESAGLNPSFLIGGVPLDFGLSARGTESPFFVIEADEYDTAFFDKRSKFVHYHPRTLILNNLEFDHADIFANLGEIERQFHHLIRTVPSQGQIIAPSFDKPLTRVLNQGVWTEVQTFAKDSKSAWQLKLLKEDASCFEIYYQQVKQGQVDWSHTGLHNAFNALAAVIAARHVGVLPKHACQGLCEFKGIKRRMELICDIGGVKVYDDFAHHPSAIATTLQGLRASCGTKRIIAVLEPRSNTMRLGVHKEQLAQSIQAATEAIWFQPEGLNWSLQEIADKASTPSQVHTKVDSIVSYLAQKSQDGDQIVIMSNGSFSGLYSKLQKALAIRHGETDAKL